MRINVLGAGPAGLYAGLLLRKADPDRHVVVHERNPKGATHGWGVVFSDRTLAALREADAPSYAAITERFVLWDAIDVHVGDRHVRCGGHAFAGIARRALLDVLVRRCVELGVDVRHGVEIDDPAALAAEADLLVAADGVGSRTRGQMSERFGPRVVEGDNRFIWLGTTRVFDSFTFIFRETEHGLFQVHAYPFDGATSTFIVECTGDTWRRAGLDEADEAASLAFCETLFAEHLNGHGLMANRSRWRCFPTVSNRRWSSGNTVLLGDAVHTAHFSIGSGTKLAMEDAIALAGALEAEAGIEEALAAYEQERRPRVELLQAAAAESQTYFENTDRYRGFEPLQFAFHLMTRSGRLTLDSLRLRDPRFVAAVERRFASNAQASSRASEPVVAPPPGFAPLELRERRLANRFVLVATPSYGAREGLPDSALSDEIGRLARSGAGLVLTPPVAVAARGRITPGDAGLYGPEHCEAWAEAVAAARFGSAALGIELSHAGRRGATRPRTRGVDRPLGNEGWPLVAASPLAYGAGSPVPGEIDRPAMDELRDAFARSAAWAAESGFDLLQINAAHGYLLAGFLSPLTNRRTDDCGGSPSNRLRFPLEVIDAVREAWPADRPLAVALSVTDWATGGLEPEDALAAARALSEHGCDLITVRAGQTTPRERPKHDPAVLANLSDWLRNAAGVRTLCTSHVSGSGGVNTLLAGGRADLCVLRPGRTEP